MHINSLNGTLSNYTIRKQLYLVYFPIIIIFTLILCFFSVTITNSNKELSESYKNLSAANAQRAKSIVFDTTNMIEKNAKFFSNDQDLRHILSNTYNSTEEASKQLTTYQILKQITIQETAIQSLKIYHTNQSIPNNDYFVFSENNVFETDWFQRAQSTANTFWEISETNLPNKEKTQHYLTLYKNIPLPLSEYESVLEIKIDYNFLKNRLKTSDYKVQLQLNDGNIFYSDDYSDIGSKLDYDNPTERASYHNEKFYNKELVASSALILDNKKDKIYIYSIDSTSSLNLKTDLFGRLIILAFSLCTTTIIVVLFARFFSKRIQLLKTAVHHASIEDYDYLISDNGKDEIADILIDFHTVIQNIILKDQKVFQSKLAEQEFKNEQQRMEFKLLASQINPHFLYNTLEAIRMLALEQDNQDVNRAIQLLAKSMRYTLASSGVNITTLEDSLVYTEIYLQIQQLRFGDRVNYTIHVSKEIDSEKISILPLLIQPIVENAIEHGLETLNKTGYISILVKSLQSNFLVIEISDNGIGIEENKLNKLRESINTSSKNAKKNIGLRNINSRIKMHYGKNSGLHIDSTYYSGTVVTLTLELPLSD